MCRYNFNIELKAKVKKYFHYLYIFPVFVWYRALWTVTSGITIPQRSRRGCEPIVARPPIFAFRGRCLLLALMLRSCHLLLLLTGPLAMLLLVGRMALLSSTEQGFELHHGHAR